MSSDSPTNVAKTLRLRPDENVISRRMGDGVVLLQLQKNSIYELNATGARLWELIATLGDRRLIEEKMREEFDVEPSVLSAEIDAILTSLLDVSLVVAYERD